MNSSFGVRLAAWFLDVLILVISAALMILTFVGIEFVLKMFIPDDLLRFPIVRMLRIPAWILTIVVPWFYYAYFESSKHKASFGKILFDLWVTDKNGQRISFWKASIRYWLKFLFFPVVPIIIYLSENLKPQPQIMLLTIPVLTYLLALIMPEKTSLHDILSGTRVKISGKNISLEGN